MGVSAGLRHSEVLAFPTFELPPVHPDGLTPLGVADKTAKGNVGPRVAAFSDRLRLAHTSVSGVRRNTIRAATWRTEQPLEIVVERTGRREGIYLVEGRPITRKWRDLDWP